MKKIIILFSVVVAILITTLILFTQPPVAKPQSKVSTPKSDAAPGYVSKKSLEDFLTNSNASADVTEAYRFALENPQGVLSQVKCYCGCLKNNVHKNNRDCFLNEQSSSANDDGTFDLMGLNCGLCVKTALTSKQMLAEGKTVQEIADYVDQRWGSD